MTTATKSNLKVRNVKFDFNNVNEEHYVANNMFATHFINSLHVIFPEGEKLFIRSVRYFENEIKNPELKKDIRSFIGQEGVHFREHERFWENLEKMGLEPMGFVNFVRTYGFDLIEGGLFKFLPKRMAQKLSLSVTAGAEHYTALFANQALGNMHFNENLMPPEMFKMWLWHAAEELEHKAVAFDVLQEVDDSYALRMTGMAMISGLLYMYSLAGMVYFISKDKNKDWNNPVQKMIEFASNYLLKPKGTAGWKLLLDYFKPGFHPNDHDNYHMAKEFFEQNAAYFEEKYATR
jgi:predicted metal-dependent hydrolase